MQILSKNGKKSSNSSIESPEKCKFWHRIKGKTQIWSKDCLKIVNFGKKFSEKLSILAKDHGKDANFIKK